MVRSTHLALDEVCQRPLSQLRVGAVCDVEGRSDHLASRTIHVDEMDQTRELLQVRDTSRVKGLQSITLTSALCKL